MKENETRKILRVVLDFLRENLASIASSGAFAGNGRVSLIASQQRFAYTPRSVFCRHPRNIWMLVKEALALCERHRVRGDGTNVAKCGAGAGNQVHFDGENRFGADDYRTL